MGGGGGGIYQSKNQDEADAVAYQTALGMLVGQPIAPSPDVLNTLVSQSVGGNYSTKYGHIRLDNGDLITLNPDTGRYEYKGSGTPSKGTETMLNQANAVQQNYQANVFGDPNSGLNQLTTYGKEYYNPETGQFQSDSNVPAQNGDYYMNKYGGYLNQEYTPAFTTDAERMNLYNKGQDQISKGFRDKSLAADQFIASQGSSLNSGRAARLKQDLVDDRNVASKQNQAEVDMRMADIDREEQRNKFKYGQEQGDKRMQFGSAADANQYARAQEQKQNYQQQKNNALQAIMSLFGMYNQSDVAAAQLDTQAAGQTMGALGSIAGAAGTAVGK